jgi:hypothetical protein
MASELGQDRAPASPTPEWGGKGVTEQTSPPLRAHKRIVDRGRMIEPVARVAIQRLARRGPTEGIKRELVMSHRDLVSLRALWLDGRGRRGPGGS